MPHLKTAFLALVATLLLPQAALGARRVALPTMEVETVHGGHSTTISCTTANMLAPSAYGAAGDDGVQMTFHIYSFNFKNLSDVTQNVRIRVLPGTRLESKKSDGMNTGIPHLWNPTRSVDSSYNMNFSIGPYADVKQDVGFFATGEQTTIKPMFEDVPNGAPHVCISLHSWLSVEIVVEEDRGAVLGSVTTKAHRGMGKTDSWQSTPISFQINGGRPF